MNSSRLPGKVLKKIGDRHALRHLTDRLAKIKNLDEIIVATTDNKLDDELVACLKDWGVKFYRGSENDVLLRVLQAAEYFNLENIVSLTGDCIFTDHKLIEYAISLFDANSELDFLTNCAEPLTWPMGQYFQIFKLKELKNIANEIYDPAVREHVTLHYYDKRNDYKFMNIIAPERYRYPSWRLQLDYKEDLDFLRRLYDLAHVKYGPIFGLHSISQVIKDNPEILTLNENCEEKSAR